MVVIIDLFEVDNKRLAIRKTNIELHWYSDFIKTEHIGTGILLEYFIRSKPTSVCWKMSMR